jgi:hypothetical protein
LNSDSYSARNPKEPSAQQKRREEPFGEEHPITPKRWDHTALVEWLSEKDLVEKAVDLNLIKW